MSKSNSSAAPVTISVPDGACGCGCGAEVAARRSFKPGHDAKLKSTLIEAHLAGAKVAVARGGAKPITRPALGWAKERGWERFLRAAQERAKARATAKAKPARNAAVPAVDR